MVQSFCVGSFLLGGFSAIIVMGLLLLFMENPLRKSEHNKALRTMVKEFLRIAQSKGAGEMPEWQAETTSEDSINANLKERISVINCLAAKKLGQKYTPASGLL